MLIQRSQMYQYMKILNWFYFGRYFLMFFEIFERFQDIFLKTAKLYNLLPCKLVCILKWAAVSTVGGVTSNLSLPQVNSIHLVRNEDSVQALVQVLKSSSSSSGVEGNHKITKKVLYQRRGRLGDNKIERQISIAHNTHQFCVLTNSKMFYNFCALKLVLKFLRLLLKTRLMLKTILKTL